METFRQDLRYGVRQLANQPGFALVAILTLALGTGANLAIFHTLDALFLKALPVRAPNEVVQVLSSRQGDSTFSNPLWEQLRDRQQVFAGAFAWSENVFNLGRSGEVRNANGVWASGNYFSTLGVQPYRGRLLTPEDDRRGGLSTVAVLGFDFWQREYGGRDDAIGQQVYLDGHAFEIIGVTPPGFFGMTVGSRFDVVIPLASEAVLRGEYSMLDEPGAWWLSVAARLRPGMTTALADAGLQTISRTAYDAAGARPHDPDDRQPVFSALPAANGVSPLRQQYRQAMWVLMAIVALVLLIACANIANLLLARAAARQKEMGVRLALGASRPRLIQQLLTEGLLLAVIGMVLAVPLAGVASRLLMGQIGTSSAGVFLDLSANWRVLLFLAGIALATTVLFGLTPAIATTRVTLVDALTRTGLGASERRGRFGLGRTLVVAQVAISMVLLAGAALLLRTFYNLTSMDLGFNTENVMFVSLDMRQAQTSPAARAVVFDQLLEGARAMPGVKTASLSKMTPITGHRWNGPVEVPGYEPQDQFESVAFFNLVAPQYFSALGSEIVAGRDFGAQDSRNAPRVAIVNQAFVKKFYGGRNPVGEHYIQEDGIAGRFSVEIVGVVKDAKYMRIREQARPITYLPVAQREAEERVNLVVRGDTGLANASAAMRTTVEKLAPQAFIEFTTLDAVVGSSLRQERLLASLSGFFGGLALLLCAMGLYGLMAHAVARRRREIGIRMALGSTPAMVVRMIMNEGLGLVLAGIVVGMAGAYAATQVLGTFLFGVTPRDPVTFAVAASVLIVVTAAACGGAARRAAHLDPLQTLRYE